MKLKAWLEKSGIGVCDFATLVGVSHSTAVRWCTGERTPGRYLIRIMDITKDAVGPSDFGIDLRPANREEVRRIMQKVEASR